MRKIGFPLAAALAASVTWAAGPELQPQSCRLQSATHRVPVLEVYTSEGCSSCPPADRWLSALPRRGVSPDTAVLLAFHVDYWNGLGWPDRFSKAAFSARQREVAAYASNGAVFTPQVVLDGRGLGVAYSLDSLTHRLAQINREPAPASISADVTAVGKELRVNGEVQVADPSARRDARVWIAVFEQGLSSKVKAGENAGQTLQHDFVVRELAGPLAVGADGRARIDQVIGIRPDWSAAQTGLAIFVQRRADGITLQATSRYPICGP
jgi:hypothetical protein